MNELPLFPLNTVLFPGMPVSLHIFEERYKKMIRHCLDEREPFGVVLIQHGMEVGARATPYAVGCTARITHLQTLEDGRFNLLAVGRDRFRIHEMREDRPYLVGLVEYLQAPDAGRALLEAASVSLQPLVSRYLQVLAKASDSELNLEQLPDDPVELGYLAASVLQIPLDQKQALLDINEPQSLLERLAAIYRREVPLVRMLLQPPDLDSVGSFSLN